MTLKFKIFLTAFVLSLPFWWGINLLEAELKDFFFWQEISQNPRIFTAQIALEEKLKELKPIRNKNIEDLTIEGKSAISFFLSNEGKEKILFGKNINQKLPIASLTKLMTALVVLKYYDLSKEIKISKEAVAQEENFGKLEVGKVFPAKYLLYPLLMESSNDAAFALANDYEGMTERGFVELMRWEAEKLRLNNTFFDNPTGLDPEESGTELNYSTAFDLIKLTKELLKKPLIWEILATPKYTLYGPELINNNELLFDDSINWRKRIVGGKTGYTEMSGGCMLLVIRAPKNQGYLINVVLGTSNNHNRFNEMKKLVNWLEEAYKW
jgi:D-alanyl-D-alanine carboxypeptidase